METYKPMTDKMCGKFTSRKGCDGWRSRTPQKDAIKEIQYSPEIQCPKPAAEMMGQTLMGHDGRHVSSLEILN